MKTLKLITLLCLAHAITFAQDTLFVSYDKVTSIAFPSAIEDKISTSESIITSIGDDNTLSLRASEKGFTETRLRLSTADGIAYDFPVLYSYGRAGRFIRIPESPRPNHKAIPVVATAIEKISQRIATTKKFRPVTHDKNNKVKSALGSVSISGNTLFYKLRIRNHSNISYDIDFIRFYIRDLKTAKRTVSQEKEIFPAYTYGLENSTVEGKSSNTVVFALDKFTLSDNKALFVEIYEKNGSRHLYMKVKDKNINKASPIRD